MDKTFKGDFDKLVEKLKTGEPFSFARFSDGELRILQNKQLTLSSKGLEIGEHKDIHSWERPEYERKNINPETDGWVRERLLEALAYNAPGYYKGISCKCCLSGKHGFTPKEEFDFQVELSGLDVDDEHLTWSNLFLNNNYITFMEHMLPYFFNYEVIMVVNEHVKLEKVPFPVKKVFTVGNNCIINDYDIIEEIKQYIEDNDIQNHLFLFSASTLSNFLNHQLYEFSNKNTYMDIGTTLNVFFDLKIDRRYLLGFWGGDVNGQEDLKKVCTWN